MSLWGKVGGAALMVGGVALTVGTAGAAAPVGAAMVGAGAGVLSADAKKDAAKKAEAQLTAASDKAIATQIQAKRENAAAFAPYTQTGANAIGALNDYMGLPSLPAPTPGAPAAQPQPRDGVPIAPLPPGMDMTKRQATPETATGGIAVPRPGGPGAPTPQTRGAQQTASGYAPLGGVGATGLVQMRAPNGQTTWVPRQQAPFYAQRGAVEVA